MNCALDSSVLVAALDDTAEFHPESEALLSLMNLSINAHALAETFNTFTGGRLGFRIAPGIAASLLRHRIVPVVKSFSLSADDLLKAMEEAETRGVRGGAIYDYLHLAAARIAGAARFYTHNTSHFLAFHRPGDPDIVHPRAFIPQS